jgi:MoaA/NifB/PqqE/SkfB family radical SAM enzyme
MNNFTPPTPIELAFEPINLCNARCFCCPYTYLEKDKEYRGKRMSHTQIKTLIDDFANGIKKYNINPNHTIVKPWRYSDPLVCPDLELIFELCQKHGLKIALTTNAVSFGEKKCQLIQKYSDTIKKINISIIGFNKEEIREWMDLDWDVTKARLIMIRDKYPTISRKMTIGVKHKIQDPKKSHYAPVVAELSKLTLGKVKKKTDWLESRVEWNGLQTDDINFKISEKQFVKGCAMVNGKILRTLEVLVDGQAVLCCDDATGQTNFGNVFDIGIKGVWTNLERYHSLIYSQTYSENKKDMMCNTCSRAKFDWDPERTNRIRKEYEKYV